MFLNLIKLLQEKNISIRAYSKIIEVKSESSAQNKIRGRTDFTLPEIVKTMELFPEYRFEWLFTKFEPVKTA